ncbi:hypothetical protein ACFLU6_12690 [Acidobacteriota bacterium]
MATSGSGGNTQTEMCSLCGNHFAPNELVIVEGNRICAGCKPRYLQLLQQRRPAPAAQAGGGMPFGRQGGCLVVRKNMALPDRCVKCNAPAEGQRYQKTLYWHNPVWYILILISPIIYIIAALIVREKVPVDLGFCQAHRSKRRMHILIIWILLAVSVGLLIVAAAAETGELAALGGLLLLGDLIYAAIAVPVVRISKVDRGYVWLKGVHKQYLETLAEWTW